MKIALDLRRSIEENAAGYFEAAKKARSKIVGAQKAISIAKENQAKAATQEIKVNKQMPKKIRKKSWYEKFKWFWTSNGLLVVAGRDATTNEMVIKKHTDDHDIVFHTDAPGSPFVVIKTDGNQVPDKVLQEAADFCASHSKAWKLGLSSAEVFWVTPDQVTKEAKAGEYMQKGSFMIYGKRNYVPPKIGLVPIPFEDKIMISPKTAAAAYYEGTTFMITPGTDKISDAAKKIVATLKKGETDDVIPNLPSGGCKLKKIELKKQLLSE